LLRSSCESSQILNESSVSGEIGKIVDLLVHNMYFHFTLGMNNPESPINKKMYINH